MLNIIMGTIPTITYTFHTVSVSDLTKAILTILENRSFKTMYEEPDSDTAQSGTGA